jgi:hypothetical protein
MIVALSILAAAQSADKSVPADLQKKINAAISKGVKALQGRMRQPAKSERVFEEKKPLIAYALLKSGVPAKDLKGLKAEFAAAAGRLQSFDKFSQMYLAGILAMFLAEFDDTQPALQKIADQIVAAQAESGIWGYTLPERYRSENVSTSQYALLGLQAAANRGCKIPPASFDKAARYFLQNSKDGGWGYDNRGNNTPHGAATAIGVACLRICRAHLDPALAGKIDPAVDAGLGWLGRNFSVMDHPGKKPWKAHKDALWLYYYLYSLERAGIFSNAPKFGDREWYREGAEFLVAKQRADGMWDPTHERHEDDDLATCFALLFLARASDGFIPTGGSK